MQTHAPTYKRWGLVFVAAAGVLAASGAGYAADLGGNCCADLEDRVAELEATVARKGNRKMSLTVYGQVNKALVWHDGFGDTARGVVDGSQSPTILGVRGEAKISPNMKAGYAIELGIGAQPLETLAPGLGIINDLGVRHSFVWVEGTIGRMSLGRTSMATDGAGEISVANTAVVSRLLSLEPLSTNVLLGIDLPYDGPRRDVVRYDSPAVAGFMLSASWSSGTGIGLGNLSGVGKDAWDVALRYAGEGAGFRVAAAVGYRKENYVVPAAAILPISHDGVFVGSASVMHTGSGLFANAAAGWAKEAIGPGGPDHNTYHFQAGWEKNVFGIGATTIFAEFGRTNIDGFSINPTLMGIGVVQSIDAAALDFYASYRQYDVDAGGDDKLNVFMVGTRIRF